MTMTFDELITTGHYLGVGLTFTKNPEHMARIAMQVRIVYHKRISWMAYVMMYRMVYTH